MRVISTINFQLLHTLLPPLSGASNVAGILLPPLSGASNVAGILLSPLSGALNVAGHPSFAA
jgi:hypothetical protein